VTGFTQSSDLPSLLPLQGGYGGGYSDGFITRYDPAGTMISSTFLGGSSAEDLEGITFDPCGNLVVAGQTTSSDYPVRDPVQATYAGPGDAVLTVIDPTLSGVLSSTFLGGSMAEERGAVAVDTSGLVTLAGWTTSKNLPTAFPLQPAHAGGLYDAYVARIDPCVCGGAAIGPVGNTVRAVQDPGRTLVTFTWAAIPLATGYNLYRDPTKSGPLVDLAGVASPGSTVLAIPYPPELLLFYRLAGTSCAGEGPK
jgi:hypothetical protein